MWRGRPRPDARGKSSRVRAARGSSSPGPRSRCPARGTRGERAAEAMSGGRHVARAELADGRDNHGAEVIDGRDVERAELVMGTVARVALPAPVASAERFAAAFAAFRDVDEAMSLYRP